MKKYILFRNIFAVIFLTCSFAVSGQKTSPQKIKITDFHLSRQENKVSIEWSTDPAIATNYFEVEKSNDGKNFKTVAYVLGANPAQKNCDCFGCFDKISGTAKESYYRLKHINIDGIVQFSEVKMLALK